MAAAVPKATGEGFLNDQGETVVSPKPGARVNKIAVIPMAAKPPAKIAPHSTAEVELSTDRSSTLVADSVFAIA
jgi:hypothetical protein